MVDTIFGHYTSEIHRVKCNYDSGPPAPRNAKRSQTRARYVRRPFCSFGQSCLFRPQNVGEDIQTSIFLRSKKIILMDGEAKKN